MPGPGTLGGGSRGNLLVTEADFLGYFLFFVWLVVAGSWHIELVALAAEDFLCVETIRIFAEWDVALQRVEFLYYFGWDHELVC